MVFQDISASFELNQLHKKKSTPNLMDRFFSFLIDYLVISPFVLFLLYFSFNNGFNFWKQNPLAPENELFVFIFSVGYVAYFSLIQALFISVWRATPGQYFLKIRIDFHESQDLIFLRALSRQLAFWFSFALLGIPFLSVMTNKKRRTFYDRIADVSVVSLKHEFENFTYDLEFKYWQSFVATLIIFVGFLFSAFIWKSYSRVVARTASFVALKEKGLFCEELEGLAIDERLPTAVALNFAGQLTDSCLDQEADFVLWRQKSSDYSLAYFAKSLTAEDVSKEKKYLRQSCSDQKTDDYSSLSAGCKYSYSFMTGEIDRLYDELKSDNVLDVVMKYELGRILEKNEETEKNFAKIEKFNSLKLVKKYQVVEMLSEKAGSRAERLPASADSEVNEMERNEKIIELIGDL